MFGADRGKQTTKMDKFMDDANLHLSEILSNLCVYIAQFAYHFI